MFLNTDIRKIDTLENTESAIKMNKPEKNWQHRVHKTKKNKTKTKHTMCWTPLCANENK